MGQNFIACDRDQVLLLSPDLREWLPAGHLALFVIDAVEELDLGGFYGAYREDGQGRPAHDPAMMVALVVYAYAKGVRSAREIERRCVEDVAFRVIAANRVPDHSTVARFLVAFELQLAGLFSQVLALCARAGLAKAGVVAVDSTKLNANASGLANRTYEQLAAEIVAEGIATDRAEDELYGGERRGDELPAEFADPRTRKQRLREAKAQLEREWQAEREAYERHQAWRAGEEAKRGRKLGGRKPKRPPEQPAGRVNLTDPDSRPVKTPRGFIQGYNAQLVCNEQQIVLAAEIKNSTMDQGMLEPMLARAGRELAAVGVADGPELVLADAGYWRTGQIRTLRDRGVKVLVPPDAHTRAEPLPGKRGGIYGWMRERLDTPEGRELYRRRQTIIEPVFGDTKFNRRADRFRRRGLAACRAEWRLITATGNLLKLWRHASALQAI